jgi:hypothetical protein
MGYRSEVYIKLKQEHLPTLVGIFHDHELDYVEYCADDVYAYAYISDIKWYQGDAVVDKVHDFIDTLGEDGGVLTVGEDGTTEHEAGELYLPHYTIVEVEEFTMPSEETTKAVYNYVKANHSECLL